MAITNYDRVSKALGLLKTGIAPFVEREIVRVIASSPLPINDLCFDGENVRSGNKTILKLDVAGQLKLMWEAWNYVFRDILGPAERNLVSELRGHQNRWAHQESFSGDDTYRVLDSVSRLLSAISAPESDEIDKLKMELLRVRFDEQVRSERRKRSGSTIESLSSSTLKPWREVITPHSDVATGRYQQAEFAADLWQVYLGQGTDEYRDPVEFFRRTFLTESLKKLLVGAIQRLADNAGDPVVHLQTNFGGGKTHTMLALFHLFGKAAPSELSGIEDLLEQSHLTLPTGVRRVVLVGNKISPGNPTTKPDGTLVRTLWGELAWQLGGARAFGRIAADDERATSPGDVIRELLDEFGPCLVLIDEWVAYARQLREQSDVPGGSFETQFSFAQVLTESAKLADRCLLVISLPASDTSRTLTSQADDVEVGGERGREALNRLRNVVSRVDSSWRPASADEGFEIVRRRLFEPLSNSEQFRDRDFVARTFSDLYRAQHHEFPPECRESEYEKRIRTAYPIHPEIFDRLYEDWSTLLKFQRTRGVLRLMAAVIHSLWEKGDSSPLILPAHIPIDDQRVQWELTRYLSESWVPVIEKDVDGSNSLPVEIDGEVPNLGKLSATRRVARTTYLGSAPTIGVAHPGLEDSRIRLGCVMPGESPAVFGDALRRLAGKATYLFQDGSRYWYSTRPTVTKLADDRAEELKRDTEGKISSHVIGLLGTNLRDRGDFRHIHTAPLSPQDVPDDFDARLVVLGINNPCSKQCESPAELEAAKILESKGYGSSSPRIFRNTLVFLAPDETRLQDLDEAVRYQLAWDSIIEETVTLNLDPQQVKQAKVQQTAAKNTVAVRLPETYHWLLVPIQENLTEEFKWQNFRLSGSDPLAVRVCKKLKGDELLITELGGSRLRMELDRIPLWRGDHIEICQLVADFAKYIYLPRLRDSSVLLNAINVGAGSLTWEDDGFAYAESFDEERMRYRGLQVKRLLSVLEPTTVALLVRPDVANRQLHDETTEGTSSEDDSDTENSDTDENSESETETTGGGRPPDEVRPKRFHGTVTLDPDRVASTAGMIATEVISNLQGIVGANVTVTLEINAKVPLGIPDEIVRVVHENARSQKFSSHGFEKD